jgi:hypothetical protein
VFVPFATSMTSRSIAHLRPNETDLEAGDEPQTHLGAESSSAPCIRKHPRSQASRYRRLPVNSGTVTVLEWCQLGRSRLRSRPVRWPWPHRSYPAGAASISRSALPTRQPIGGEVASVRTPFSTNRPQAAIGVRPVIEMVGFSVAPSCLVRPNWRPSRKIDQKVWHGEGERTREQRFGGAASRIGSFVVLRINFGRTSLQPSRCAINCLIAAIAFAGLRPLGHELVQFMIV